MVSQQERQGLLEDVVDFYDRGGNSNPYLDAELRRLNLAATEKQALVTFLHALSGHVQDGIPPQFLRGGQLMSTHRLSTRRPVRPTH